MINVLSFETRYRAGKREDWITYAPKHAPNCITSDRVDRLRPPEEFKNDNAGTKAKHMNAVWAVIQPAYEAWLRNEEIPESGIPLSAWPGVNDAQVAELRKHSIRTVEDVAGITDAQAQKIQLPDVRSLRRQAQAFKDGQEGAEQARRLAEQEDAMAAMREQMEAMAAKLAEKEAAEAEDEPKKRGPGRPRKEATEAA